MPACLTLDMTGGAQVTAVEEASITAYTHKIRTEFVGAPAWFGPAVAAAVGPAVVAAVGPAVAAAIAPVVAKLDQLSAKIANANAHNVADPLIPLPDNAGVLPVAVGHFVPATRAALDNLTIAQCDALLGHYGIVPAGAVADRRNQIRVHWNIPLPEFS
eukprot:TRINITY_DN6752_c0_g1_i2.p1 TRINITY_DN6752_c0_g1~~TRINITY_DN6752_c0_g1_i2.p1  ORF type:complete len:159 (+),score=24.75 TRINITY_DN6752_c0_g1_i2:177-653(+)